MDAGTVFLNVAAAVTAGFGVIYLVRSRGMAGLVGIELPSRSARADFRAIYGGAQVGIGLFFAACARHSGWELPGLWAVALFAGGFGLARLGSLVVDRAGWNPQWVVAALELVIGAIAGWLAIRAR
jgi:Domain of unknown function (DUF4345)